uniref:Uncharacterized protein LOC111110444 n=1 Tax=Crassostrea virginica TaxID=6565 RepID=A0A8B8BHB5_CRAVI|nr:uncharacterized protein LOC111110444 [Crassostrea virginica]
MQNRKYSFLNGNATVRFHFQNLNESGNYQCYVEHHVNGKYMIKNDSVTLTVKELNIIPKPIATESCFRDTCSFIERCYKTDDTAVCSKDIWKIILLFFITFSLILGMATVSLCLLLKIHKRRKGYIKDDFYIGDGEGRNYETLGSRETHTYPSVTQAVTIGLEERNYESRGNGMTDTYSSIDERALRDGEGAHYESLGRGETHAYSSIQPTVSI